MVGSLDDPQPGVHVAEVDQSGGLVHGDAPDLGGVVQDAALGGADRVVRAGWDEVGDLPRCGRVAGVDQPHPVAVPGGVDVGADQQRVVDDIVAGSLVVGAQRVRRPVVADLYRVGKVGVVVDPQVAVALLGGAGGGLTEILVGGEQQVPRVVVARRVPVAVRGGRVDGAAAVHRVRRVGHVDGDEAAVPVGQEGQLAVVGGLGAVAVDRVGVAAQSGGWGAAEVVHDSPVGHLRRLARVGDVDQPEVAAALLVAAAGGRGAVRVLAGRHRRVHVRAAQVGPVLYLQFVDAPGAAASVQPADVGRVRGVGHVPHLQAAEQGEVVARSARLDAGDRDVVPRQPAVPGGEDHDVLGGGARRVLQLRHDGRLAWCAGVDHL